MKEDEFKNPEVATIFATYPEKFRNKLLILRQLIFDTALTTNGVGVLEETLKWREPSYLANQGSTIRIDWKPKTPNQYAIYFKCTSLLVPTFKKLYPNEFTFEGNRAIVFNLDDKIPVIKLRHCIEMALTYHIIKNSLIKKV